MLPGRCRPCSNTAMARRSKHHLARWTLPDVIDLEAELARAGHVTGYERAYFVREIRPQLSDVRDPRIQRRIGLRLWLEHRRGNKNESAGGILTQLLRWVSLVLATVMAVAGTGLVSGLLAGTQQAVHVVIFFGLALGLPWLLYLSGLLIRAITTHRVGLAAFAGTTALRLTIRDRKRRERITRLLDALNSEKAARRAVSATLQAIMQRSAAGFHLGVVASFVGCLLLLDVHFYWAATPRAGMADALSMATQLVAAPWAWAWPQAVPNLHDILASRAAGDASAIIGDGSWWRFLLLSLLVWGLLPRILLVAGYQAAASRALSKLAFQAPRHRALWRKLNTIERGEVAPGPTDGVLVLDVGGHGLTGADMRGFLLRQLRVNPLTTLPIAVLDANREAAAERKLAAGPAGVVLLVEGWTLSPRQVEALQARLRGVLGKDVRMTWLIFAINDGQPVAPATDDLQRWTRKIDQLRDPAAEVLAYGN